MIKHFSTTILFSLSSLLLFAQLNSNQQRMEKRIAELAQFGKDANGKGYRVAYSKSDIEGRNYLWV